MDNPEITELFAPDSERLNESLSETYPLSPASSAVLPQTCSGCASSKETDVINAPPQRYIYAIGRIETRFPRPSVEKELAQATGRAETSGLTDLETLKRVLSLPQNRYIVRQLCWVMTIEGLETYMLVPRDPADFNLLVESLRPTSDDSALDCVIGLRGPIATPDACNGLMVPIVAFDQIYSFDRAALLDAMPRQGKNPEAGVASTAAEVFDRIIRITDNAGSTDEHRALNYLALRYHAVYVKAAEAFGQNASLSAVQVRRSDVSRTRTLVDVIFSYTKRTTDFTEKFSVRVDVTEEFPFLVSKLSPYYDH